MEGGAGEKMTEQPSKKHVSSRYTYGDTCEYLLLPYSLSQLLE